MDKRAVDRRALVTDGQERWTIAVGRSLHRAGFDVTVVADSRPAVAQWSRFCDERIQVSPPQEGPESFVAALEAVVSSAPTTVLLVGGDASLQAVSEHRERLEPHVLAGLGLPSREAVRASADKAQLVDTAAGTRLACPESALCSGVDEALRAAVRFGYPVMVKPRSSVYAALGKTVRGPSRVAASADELRELVHELGDTCLVQRSEEGVVHSCSGVLADGRLLAVSLVRYLRTWPPEAGSAALAETVDVPPELEVDVSALLLRLGWQGIFELELLRRPDGGFAAIDLNPRVFGSLSLPIRAGADLPAIWCDWLLGGSPSPVVAKPGFRYRWEDAEIRRIVWELRRGHVGAAAAIARPHRRTVHPQFAWDDPAPLVARAVFLARGRVRSRRRSS